MNEKLKKELDAVAAQGQAKAKRFLLRKVAVMSVALAAILGCFLLFTPLPCIASQLLILFLVRMFSVKTQGTMQDALYADCDPYLQYAFLESYSKMPFGKMKKVQESALVSRAQCMVLAGEPQMALSLLHEIEAMKGLSVPTRAVCYNLMLRCYAQYGWEQKRRDLVAQIKEEMKKLSNKEGVYMDVILRLEDLAKEQEAGNVEMVEEYYDSNEGTYMFQKVSSHFALADVKLRAGRLADAEEHMAFVREHGNKLYYMGELEKQLTMQQKKAKEDALQVKEEAEQEEA